MNGPGIFHRPDLEIESAKTASFTAEAGYIYPVTLTSVTADLAVTFPSSPATDDRFGVYVSAAHSSGGTSSFAVRPFFCVEPANSTSINGSSYDAKSGDGGGYYSQWAAGELMYYTYDGSTWIAEDHLIPHYCEVNLITTEQEVGDTSSDRVEYNNEIDDALNMHSGDGFVWLKRSSNYHGSAQVTWPSNSTGVRLALIGRSAGQEICRDEKQAANSSATPLGHGFTGVAGTSTSVNVLQTSGGPLNLPVNTNHFTIQEVR